MWGKGPGRVFVWVYMKLLVIVLLFPLFAACDTPVSVALEDTSIPACLKKYSQKGSSEALDELLEEYQKTIDYVSKKDDIFLIKDIQKNKGDFYKIEDWVCRAQTKYGKPN